MKFRNILMSLLLTATPALADTAGDSENAHEYKALQQEMKRLEQRLKDLEARDSKKAKDLPAAPRAAENVTNSQVAKPQSLNPTPTARIEQQVKDIQSSLDSMRSGTYNFLFAGSLAANGTFPTTGSENSSFGTAFEPIMLWRLSDKLFVESEVEVEMSGSGDTSVNLEYAQVGYFLNDYVMLGAGKFLSPTNVFVERYAPVWINRLPDTPLAVYDGLLPESEIGAQARGGIPLGDTSKLLYAVYGSNGPSLVTSTGDELSAGQLNFSNFDDNNRGKAVGGRVSILPVSQFELGYAFQYADVGDRGSDYKNVSSNLQSVDLTSNFDVEPLAGRFQILGQYVWSNVDSASYQIDNATTAFTNNRRGGYFQASYRPTKAGMQELRAFEIVARWDELKNPTSAPDSSSDSRVTVGLDYWLRANTAAKIAYRFDNASGGSDQDALLVQLATGLF